MKPHAPGAQRQKTFASVTASHDGVHTHGGRAHSGALDVQRVAVAIAPRPGAPRLDGARRIARRDPRLSLRLQLRVGLLDEALPARLRPRLLPAARVFVEAESFALARLAAVRAPTL